MRPEKINNEAAAGSGMEKSPKRRKNITARVLAAAVCLCLLIIIPVASKIYTASHYVTTFYREESSLLQEDLRIVFIADTHGRVYGGGGTELTADISSLEPDLIILGGDMITRDDEDISPMLGLCSRLTQIAPVYGVLGNHESERIYHLGDSDLISMIDSTGVILLRNEDRLVSVGENTVRLVGVEGTEAGVDLYGARQRLDGMDFGDGVYTVMIAHIPALFREKLMPYDFDLGLAGHVHGGIVRLPFIGGLYSYEEGFFPRFSRGKYSLDNGADLIVSGGMGDSGWMPRINNMPELVVIDIVGK